MGGERSSLKKGPILLALGDAHDAQAALRVVKRLCARSPQRVRLMHASEPAMSTEEVLEHLGLQAKDVEGLVVEPLTGPPAQTLLDAARAEGCGLIILGLRPKDDEPGEVLRKLLLEAPCPLLLVPPDLRPNWGEGGTVLLPLDGTPSTASVAPLAIDLAARNEAGLEILYVGVPRQPSEPGSMVLPSFLDQPQHEWAMWKREFLFRFGECFWGGKLPMEASLVLATGDPGDAILELAKRHPPDLIVIGWHGELDRARAQTLRKVLRHSRWPVLASRV